MNKQVSLLFLTLDWQSWVWGESINPNNYFWNHTFFFVVVLKVTTHFKSKTPNTIFLCIFSSIVWKFSKKNGCVFHHNQGHGTNPKKGSVCGYETVCPWLQPLSSIPSYPKPYTMLCQEFYRWRKCYCPHMYQARISTSWTTIYDPLSRTKEVSHVAASKKQDTNWENDWTGVSNASLQLQDKTRTARMYWKWMYLISYTWMYVNLSAKCWYAL